MNHDPVDPEITLWFSSLQDGDEEAAARLFEHCFPRMLRYARARLPARLRRSLDEEDVALSAFKSLFDGARRGAYAAIEDRDALWRLLTCITARKGAAHLRSEQTRKRGGGRVRGESIFDSPPGDSESPRGLEQIPDRAPPAGVVDQLSDRCQQLLDALDDPVLQTIALLRLEGYTVEQIASRVGGAKRSVERRLTLIRKIWSEDRDS